MEEAKIGVYNTIREHFALVLSSHKIGKFNGTDKTMIGYEIGRKLKKRRKKLDKCILYPLKNKEGYPATESDLQIIANGVYYQLDGKNLEIEINMKVQTKK